MITGILITCFVIQLLAWGLIAVGFERARRISDVSLAPRADDSSLRISVVVAARNEEKHIGNLIEALDRQTRIPEQILIVDDGSDDATGQLVKSWQQRQSNVEYLLNPNQAQPRKKNALTAAIARTQNANILLTDADCIPRPGWVKHMSHYFSQNNIVTGYSPFIKTGSWVNRVAAYETLMAGILGAATIGLDYPYTAVGRNIGYGKELFERVGGFSSSMNSLSGDDDLFVQHAHSEGARVVHAFGEQTYVPSHGPESWKEWFVQKRRHTSASRNYRPGTKFLLLIFHLSNLLVLVLPFVVGSIGWILLGSKLAAEWMVVGRAASVLDERSYVPLYPLWSCLYVIYNTIIAPVGVVSRPKSW